MPSAAPAGQTLHATRSGRREDAARRARGLLSTALMGATAPVLATLAAGVLCVPAAAESYDERVPVEAGGLLELDVDFGDGMRPDVGFLQVTSHEAREVRLEVDASGWGASGVEFRIDHDARSVRVFGRVGGALSWMFGGPRVEVRVWVPERFSVDLRASAAPVRVEDLRGGVRVRADDGGVEISLVEGPVRVRANAPAKVSEVTGPVDVKLAEGDVDLAWITGDVEARTGGGEIQASHVVGSFSASTDDGGIEVRDLEGRIDARSERGTVFASFVAPPAGLLETQRGSVRVLLPGHGGAKLEAWARGGNVEIGESLRFRGNGNGERATGTLRGGGAPLRLYTARGAIHVHER